MADRILKTGQSIPHEMHILGSATTAGWIISVLPTRTKVSEGNNAPALSASFARLPCAEVFPIKASDKRGTPVLAQRVSDQRLPYRIMTASSPRHCTGLKTRITL